MKFDLPKELSSIIKVIGVGGGGSNAVNHMFAQGIKGVDFIICNTDKQALDISPVPVKLQLGIALTEGLGAGSIPERGNQAAQENIEEIRQLLGTRTKMVFITAGMGGGTGTGAGPVIARIAREMGILTVGIVTMPFSWEGRKRKQQATAGIEELRQAVDTLLVINNEKLRELFGNLNVGEAFIHADNVLTTAARGIAEIITVTGKVNTDFEDVKTVMSNSGVAIMGSAECAGEDRALRAAQEALASPLLNDNDISGAKYVLLNITYGDKEVLMDEITGITDHIQDAAGSTADVIWGYCQDTTLGEKVRVTVIATGFRVQPDAATLEPAKPERKVTPLTADVPTMITQPIVNPVAISVPRAEAPMPKVETPQPKVEPQISEPYLKVVEPVRAAAPAPAPEPAPAPAPKVEEPLTQSTFEFEITNEQRTVAPLPAPAPEKIVHQLTPDPVQNQQPSEPVRNDRIAPAEHQMRVEDRIAKMRELTLKLRSPNGLADLEREPAYKRKNLTLTDGPRSTESNVSRYTLSEGTDENGERRTEIKKNNPFLHDNVD
ncbi:MAG: cell division protein FtsZ [Flavobacteriales bacterium]|nr:cell division protein FtsZ [Flavobacteriales bacterium]